MSFALTLIESNSRWIKEEDEILRRAVAKYGSKNAWQQISACLPGRTNKSCRKRWIHSLDPTLRKGRWSASEDALLIATVKNVGSRWWEVAQRIPGRTDDQCAKRWREKLDPSISQAPWSPDEDCTLLDAHHIHGQRWNVISTLLSGRPAVHCRNRCKSLISRRIRSRPEDEVVYNQPAPSDLTLTTRSPSLPVEALNTETARSPSIAIEIDLDTAPAEPSTWVMSPKSTISSPSAPRSSGLTESPLTTLSSPLVNDDLSSRFGDQPSDDVVWSNETSTIQAASLAGIENYALLPPPFFINWPSHPELEPFDIDNWAINAASTSENSTEDTSVHPLLLPSEYWASHPTPPPKSTPCANAGGFVMTCPQFRCSFQAESLVDIWKHMTIQHIIGSGSAI